MGKFSEFYAGSTMIEEGVVDWVFTYQLLKRLGLPFTKWPAYANGLIDDKGKLLRKPTSEDRSAYWGYFDRITWNIKKIITTFTGHSQLTSALVSLYLLKEGINEKSKNIIAEKLFGEKIIQESEKLSPNEINANYNILKKEFI